MIILLEQANSWQKSNSRNNPKCRKICYAQRCLSRTIVQWHPTPVLLPGKSHGWRSLEGCSLWGHWGSDMTERLHFHFSLSCIGEGNGNPLQCSCLENPRDGGAWWASVYGVAQSRTRLKRLSSSSSMNGLNVIPPDSSVHIHGQTQRWFVWIKCIWKQPPEKL